MFGRVTKELGGVAFAFSKLGTFIQKPVLHTSNFSTNMHLNLSRNNNSTNVNRHEQKIRNTRKHTILFIEFKHSFSMKIT